MTFIVFFKDGSRQQYSNRYDEYNNFESFIAYDGDVDAIRLVVDYWGWETAKSIKCFSAFYSIESLMSNNQR